MTDNALQITMVCARIAPPAGGTELHVLEVSQRLASRGHKVTVLTTVLDPAHAGESIEHDVRIVRLRAWPRDSDLFFAPSIRRHITQEPADIVHIQGYHTMVAPIAMAGAISTGRPFVVTFHSGGHSSRIRQALRPVHQQLLRPQLSRAARLIGVSRFETAFFKRRLRLPETKFETITNGVDPVFRSVSPNHDLVPTISSIGRLEEYKGHQFVIDAFTRVQRSVPNVRLRIVGCGHYRRNLVHRAKAAGIADRVDFMSVPFGDRRAMAECMASSNVVVLASRYESQCIVGLEAVASGTRLVAVDASALTDLAQYSTVRMVPTTSIEDLAPALIGQIAQIGAIERIKLADWDDTTNLTESTYRSAITSPQQTA